MVAWVLLVLGLVAGSFALVWWFQERLIFFPQPLVSTSHLTAESQPVELAVDGARLHGWIRPGRVLPSPLLLYFGGNAEEVSRTLVDARWPRDWAIAAVNYRGYGRSEGAPSEAALVRDAVAIYDAISARPDVDPARIVAFGRSLGTGVAVQLAAARPVAGVILVSPYDSLVELGRLHYPWLPVSWMLRHRFDVSAHAAKLRVPLLAIVADSDAVVPSLRSRALFDQWAGPKRWLEVPRTNHNSVGNADVYWAAISAYLAERAPTAR